MHRLSGFDGLRAIAAYWVVLFHLDVILAGFSSAQTTKVIVKGYLGVDVFFILSGFVLAYVYSRDADGGTLEKARFYWARLARIYPMHILTFCAVIGVGYFNVAYWGDASTLRTDIPTALANVFLVHTWGLFDKLSWNFPSWSLSAEWGAYLIFPFAMAISLRFANRPLWAAIISLAFIAGWALFAFHFSGEKSDAPFDLTYDYGLVRVASEFCAGILLFRLYRGLPANLPTALVQTLTPAALVLLLTVIHLDWGQAVIWQDFLFVALAAVLILALAIGKSPLDRMLQGNAARYLGEISYGIYLWHGVVIAWLVVMKRAENPVGRYIMAWVDDPAATSAIVMSVFILVTSTALAALSLRYFEKPMRNTMRSWWDQRFPAKLAAQSG